jgi:hypothetical protein
MGKPYWTKEYEMNAVIREYKNEKNGGSEQVSRNEKGEYFVSSDWGQGPGPALQVSENEMVRVLDYTNAPIDVAMEILLG